VLLLKYCDLLEETEYERKQYELVVTEEFLFSVDRLSVLSDV
jgi:hypothetical protein